MAWFVRSMPKRPSNKEVTNMDDSSDDFLDDEFDWQDAVIIGSFVDSSLGSSRTTEQKKSSPSISER